MDLLLATRNAHKTREFSELLGQTFCVRDLTRELLVPAIAETGSTFEENAEIKALAISRNFPEVCVIADDSGLEVDALGGKPGIFSARYAGEGATDRQNIEKLLADLSSVAKPPSELRRTGISRAGFRCAIAVAKGGALLTTLAGEVAGHIVGAPSGMNGFGYDPIFVPDGYSQTFAQLPAEVKNQISHRARATAKLREFLATGFS